MIAELVVFGLLAGMDNLQVCSSLGLLPLRRGRMRLLAAAFSVSEIAAAGAGVALGHAMLATLGELANRAAPLIVFGCGAAVLLLALRHENMEKLANGRAVLLGLPLSLGLDNLFAGAGISFSAYPVLPAVLIIGATSAALSCIGLYFGASIRRFLPDRVQLLAGAYLCFMAVRMALPDRS